MAERKIKRALIAVYDKTGIADFARALVDEFGIEIISTGGTAKHLKDAGIPVTMVEEVTGFPEMLDGRVKTLHPKIHAAILADRDNPEHMRQLAEHGIKPIDMVVVNLYPFEKTVADPNCTMEQAIEMIDIGGPCMLRAAAKNHRHVLVVPYSCYDEVLAYLLGMPSQRDVRQYNTACAFALTNEYDKRIVEYFQGRVGGRNAWKRANAASAIPWDAPDSLDLDLELICPSKYGENPHQRGGYYGSNDGGIERCLQILGDFIAAQPTISFNNYVDADAALALCSELTQAGEALWHRFSTGVCSTGFQPVQVRPDVIETRKSTSIQFETITRRNLPHLQVPGSTYFVTFRLRAGVLVPEERSIVLDACKFWHGKKMTLHCVVIMPDHVHLLMTPHELSPGNWVPLSELLHSIKRHSANEINKARGATGSLWLDESFDRMVRNNREFMEKWEYMEANPVTAGIAKPGEYPWWWQSSTGFQETLDDTHRLETCDTGHRLETGATGSGAASAGSPKSATCCFIKHTNACGVGVADDPIEAYRRAYLGDVNAAMGGILAVNFVITAEFAEAVMHSLDRWGKAEGAGAFFVEVWVAPSFDEDAVKVIRSAKKWGENVRLLAVGDMSAAPDANALEYKTIAGGMLVQTRDNLGLNEDHWKVVTKRQPTESEMSDLRLSWLIAKHTKSNAISICKDGMLIGNGAGQMSRVMSCRIATWLAKENGHSDMLAGSAAASDAFFPFRDGPDILMDAGVTAIIQPGGSKRDEDTIKACDERGVAMIFTGTRHFKH
ncbi:MAG: transposase [Planctomycetes bacterium]|nr:transposase [Planctomycetota bacterium]